VVCTDQREPSQRSANVERTELKPLPRVVYPTAVQASREAQETAPSSLSALGPPSPRRSRSGSIAHLLPSQSSANILLAASPMAVQTERALHETLSKAPPGAR
jgi:hypothetical protein